MNGAQRIRAACTVWYLMCVITLVPMILISIPRDDGAGDRLRNIFTWVGISVLGSLPFVFLIHLLAAIWETLIGMALQSEDRTEARPPSGPGPQA